MTAIEVAANAVNAGSIVLAARNSVHTWWTGIAGCALFAVVFLRARLYADVTLQGFFIACCVIGWIAWRRGGASGAELPVRRTSARLLALAAVSAALVTVGYAALLARFTNAAAPLADSAVLAGSVIAQLLLMARRVESWWFWLAVDTVAVPLYASRSLLVTAALYAVFWVNAVVGLVHWRRLASR
jgi:nicotinamide mononucleotide transporter